MNIAVTEFSVRTPLGTAKSGHGISFAYNKANVSKADRAKREARRLSNRSKRDAWDKDSRATSGDLATMVQSGYKD